MDSERDQSRRKIGFAAWATGKVELTSTDRPKAWCKQALGYSRSCVLDILSLRCPYHTDVGPSSRQLNVGISSSREQYGLEMYVWEPWACEREISHEQTPSVTALHASPSLSNLTEHYHFRSHVQMAWAASKASHVVSELPLQFQPRWSLHAASIPILLELGNLRPDAQALGGLPAPSMTWLSVSIPLLSSPF